MEINILHEKCRQGQWLCDYY